MSGDAIKITIRTDASNWNIGLFRDKFDKCIETGIRQASQALLKDCRPYVPMLTGRLRDSGHLVALEGYAFQLVWDAANPRDGYKYARIQYDKILQHVDGKYASQWVKRTMQDNPGRYVWIANRAIEAEILRMFGV